MFGRCRAFTARCADVTSLLDSVSAFRLLGRLPMCGPKAPLFAHLITGIHTEFVAAVAHVRKEAAEKRVVWVPTHARADWFASLCGSLMMKVRGLVFGFVLACVVMHTQFLSGHGISGRVPLYGVCCTCTSLSSCC